MPPRDRVEPGPGQESVWDYPRPPRVQRTSKHIRVTLGGITVAETDRAIKVMETSHPPVYYIPPDDVTPGALSPSERTTFCEYKGRAAYHHVTADGIVKTRCSMVVPRTVRWFL
jgi:uncharacterized protein (DUF427 family)